MGLIDKMRAKQQPATKQQQKPPPPSLPEKKQEKKRGFPWFRLPDHSTVHTMYLADIEKWRGVLLVPDGEDIKKFEATCGGIIGLFSILGKQWWWWNNAKKNKLGGTS